MAELELISMERHEVKQVNMQPEDSFMYTVKSRFQVYKAMKFTHFVLIFCSPSQNPI
jgi:hypothetical protein